MNPFGHIDLRITNMVTILPFYEKLLPALGFTRTFHTPAWKVFAAERVAQRGLFRHHGRRRAPAQRQYRGFLGGQSRDGGSHRHACARKRGKITSGPQSFPLALATMLSFLRTLVAIRLK
jgi:hypothetical protein